MLDDRERLKLEALSDVLCLLLTAQRDIIAGRLDVPRTLTAAGGRIKEMVEAMTMAA